MDRLSSRLRDYVSGAAALVSSLMLFVATFSVVVQIVMRYQNNPLLWSIELSQFAVIAMVFIGAAAAGGKQHFRIDYLAGIVGGRAGRILGLISRLISLITLAFLCLFTVKMLQSVMNTYSTAAQLPVRYVYYLMIYGVVSWIIVVVMEFFDPREDNQVVRGGL